MLLMPIGRPGLGVLVQPLGEQNLRPQCLEAVAPAQPVQYADQVVQALGVGVGDRVVEVAQDVGFPVRPGPDQVVESIAKLGRHRAIPRLVALLRLVEAGGVVDAIERFLEPVGFAQYGIARGRILQGTPIGPTLTGQVLRRKPSTELSVDRLLTRRPARRY